MLQERCPDVTRIISQNENSDNNKFCVSCGAELPQNKKDIPSDKIAKKTKNGNEKNKDKKN